MDDEETDKRETVMPDLLCSASTYRLIEPLGQGGMGNVFKALRTTGGGHKQTVALKLVRDKHDTASCEALMKEARRISEIRHDNIVSFVDSGITEDNQLYIALEYIPGLDLNQLLDLHNLNLKGILGNNPSIRIPDAIVGFILLMAARALDAAHTHRFADGKTGLVNRDVSPDNIVIAKNFGFVKQIDFGVAETLDDLKMMHTESGERKHWGMTGKLFYMSPEEINNEKPDARTDIFALGLVGRKLVTGFDQYDCLDPTANFMKYLCHIMSLQEGPLTPLGDIIIGVDKRLDEILQKMTEPKMEKRYQSADALRTDLEDFLYTREGKGPTVNSLQTYIGLLKNRIDILNEREMDSISFLKDPTNGKIKVREPYTMTQRAQSLWEKGVNPASPSRQ